MLYEASTSQYLFSCFSFLVVSLCLSVKREGAQETVNIIGNIKRNVDSFV